MTSLGFLLQIGASEEFPKHEEKNENVGKLHVEQFSGMTIRQNRHNAMPKDQKKLKQLNNCDDRFDRLYNVFG